jgi:ribose transport system substrate-binding protein
MHKTKRLLVAALAILMASSGCNRSETVRIGVVPKAVAHEFWIAVQAGAREAGVEAGVTIEWQGPAAETAFSRQIEIVEAMINSRVDGLVLAPTEATALVGAVERAAREGIPVTIFDSGINTDNYVSFVASNNYEAGVTAARTLADLLGGRGEVVVVKNVAGSSSTMQREAGFEETLAKDYPGIEIVDFKYCQSDRAVALTVTENMLTAHPDLDGMFASAEPGTVGAAKALRNRGLTEQVQLVGFDWTYTLERDFREGVVRALVVQDPFEIGRRAVQTVLAALRGETPPKRIDTDTHVVTLENIDTPEIEAVLRIDLGNYLP